MSPEDRIAELERYAAEADARDTTFSRGWAAMCRSTAERIRRRVEMEKVRVVA